MNEYSIDLRIFELVGILRDIFEFKLKILTLIESSLNFSKDKGIYTFAFKVIPAHKEI